MKYFILCLLLLQLLVILAMPVFAQDSGLNPPKLQVNIPTLNTSSFTSANSGDWLAIYIAAIYKYATGIVGILATVVMMYGGVIWLTAGGDSGKVSEAKDWIKSSLIGLVITLSSYTILYTINPDLVTFQSLRIDKIQNLASSENTADKSQTTQNWEATTLNKSIDNLTYYYIPSLNVGDKEGGIQYIKDNEGLKLQPYADANFYSIGYGHFLSQSEYNDIKKNGGKITEQQAENFFSIDYNKAVADAKQVSQEYDINFNNLTVPRQNALIDMAYNMGGGDINNKTGLAGFTKTLTAIKNKQWQTAAQEILNSRYANQVGARAEKNAAIMLKGK